jgi:hypothetical protein
MSTILAQLPTELLDPICEYVARDDMISALHLAGTGKKVRAVLERQSRVVVRRVLWTKNRDDFTFLRLRMAVLPCPLKCHWDKHLSYRSNSNLTWNGKASRFQCNSCIEQVQNAKARATTMIECGDICQGRDVNAICTRCAEAMMECAACAKEEIEGFTFAPDGGAWVTCCWHHRAYTAWRQYLRAIRQVRENQNRLRIPGDLRGLPGKPIFKCCKVNGPASTVAGEVFQLTVDVPSDAVLQLLKCADHPNLLWDRYYSLRSRCTYSKEQKQARILVPSTHLLQIERWLTKHDLTFVKTAAVCTFLRDF